MLNFFYSLLPETLGNLTVEIEEKNQKVGEKFSCLFLRTVGFGVKGLVSACSIIKRVNGEVTSYLGLKK